MDGPVVAARTSRKQPRSRRRRAQRVAVLRRGDTCDLDAIHRRGCTHVFVVVAVIERGAGGVVVRHFEEREVRG